MDSKDRLAELVAGMTEAQAAPLLSIAQTYLAAMRDAEEKGRTDISGEVIQYLSKTASIRDAATPRETVVRNGSAWSSPYQQQSPAPAFGARSQDTGAN